MCLPGIKRQPVARFLRFRFDVLGAREVSKRTGWGREFDDPIELPSGGRLGHAIAWLAKEIPKRWHQ